VFALRKLDSVSITERKWLFPRSDQGLVPFPELYYEYQSGLPIKVRFKKGEITQGPSVQAYLVCPAGLPVRVGGHTEAFLSLRPVFARIEYIDIFIIADHFRRTILGI